MSSLLVSYDHVFAENDNSDYNGLVIISGQLDSLEYIDGNNNPYLYSTTTYADIYTNDDTSYGSVTVTWNNRFGTPVTSTFEYNGRHTHIIVNSASGQAFRLIDVNVTNKQTFTFDPDNISATAFVLTEDNMHELDNITDTITWNNIYTGKLKYSTTWDGELVLGSAQKNFNTDPIYFDFPVTNDLRYNASIYHIRVPLDTTDREDYSITKLQLYYIGNSRINLDINYYLVWNRQSLDIYIYNSRYFYSSNMRIELQMDDHMYLYGANDAVYEYILSSDIEYWTLLTYFEQNNVNNEMAEENDNLSNSVDNYVQTEDSLIDDFDTAISNNSVDPLQIPNSNPGNWGTGFTGSLGLIGHVFNMLTASATGGNAVYLLMNFSLMLGLALLIIGKRG